MNEYSRQMYTRDPITSCFVPTCKNKVINTPQKEFFRVPDRSKEDWCIAVGKTKTPKGALYICEDHLNVEVDLLNYEDWKSKNVHPKLRVEVPNLRNIFKSTGYSLHAEPKQAPTSSTIPLTHQRENKSSMCKPEMHHKYVQVKPKTSDRTIGSSKPFVKTMKKGLGQGSSAFKEEDFSDNLTPSVVGSTVEFSDTESSASVIAPKKEVVGRQFILNLIQNKPAAYIGVPKQFFWLIEYIEKNCNINSLHIIIILYKIKNNETFQRISDIFQISVVTLWRIYHKILPILQKFFIEFIYWPSAIDIKRNLPTVFRSNDDYASVQSIIDCFEIEIEKPKKPIEQSLTWSQYKSCNTIKYLIGATPDGFINFISEGYGGRISDIKLVEQSGFLETVPEKCTILADRGFKYLESLLTRKSVRVLRPPSVTKDCKMTKPEVIESKVIASLRVHIERVIRRVRLYRVLKPHSVVNNKLVNSLDDVVVIACGLINLQSPILKTA